MIDFKCPKCQEHMSVPDSLAGQTETCPSCGNVTIVPQVIGGPPTTTMEDRPGCPPGEKVKCPNCSEPVFSDASICPHCRCAIYSKDKGKNALYAIIAFIVTFLILWYLILSWSSCEAERMMKNAPHY